jgi:hypothetical protein
MARITPCQPHRRTVALVAPYRVVRLRRDGRTVCRAVATATTCDAKCDATRHATAHQNCARSGASSARLLVRVFQTSNSAGRSGRGDWRRACFGPRDAQRAHQLLRHLLATTHETQCSLALRDRRHLSADIGKRMGSRWASFGRHSPAGARSHTRPHRPARRS